MLPVSVMYSTDRSSTSSTAPGTAGTGPACSLGFCLAGTLDTCSPHRPQRWVPDLVEGVVEQREGRTEGDDAGAGDDRPQVLPGLERLVVLGPVEHRSPARGVRVGAADQLQPRSEPGRVQRVGQE